MFDFWHTHEKKRGQERVVRKVRVNSVSVTRFTRDNIEENNRQCFVPYLLRDNKRHSVSGEIARAAVQVVVRELNSEQSCDVRPETRYTLSKSVFHILINEVLYREYGLKMVFDC